MLLLIFFNKISKNKVIDNINNIIDNYFSYINNLSFLYIKYRLIISNFFRCYFYYYYYSYS